jgi:hypothetical protein
MHFAELYTRGNNIARQDLVTSRAPPLTTLTHV